MKPIDIFITAYLREQYTEKTLEYLYERTNYPFRVFLLDNGGNWQVGAKFKDKENFFHIEFHKNLGIHAAWNIAASLAESDYFITSDNDIWVPDLENLTLGHNSASEKPINLITSTIADKNCWLTRLVKYMDEKPDFAAISLHPHVFIGIAGEDPNDPEDVKEAPMCGAVMRIMRTEAVRKVGGWEHFIEAGRNHEERTICSRLHDAGYKVGRTTRIRAYHPFGKELGGNWGYPKEFTPQMQKHTPELEPYVQQFDNIESYDNKTWLPK